MFEKLRRAYIIFRRDGSEQLVDSITSSAKWHARMARQRIKTWPQYWYRTLYRDATADPYSLIDIAPTEVEYLVSPQFQGDLLPDSTYVIGGDWDRRVADTELHFINDLENSFAKRTLVLVDKYVFYRSIENHIRRGTPWEETDFYEWVRTFGDFPDHILYGDRETGEWRFDQLDRLADSMREEGYKSQRECVDDATVVSGEECAGTTVSRWARSEDVPPEFHEVMMNIGRNGELIFEEGRHRFAVARALGIEAIPVRIFVRHVEWQKKRKEVANASDPTELSKQTRECLSHPDLAALRTF